jgi:hypothetical protein
MPRKAKTPKSKAPLALVPPEEARLPGHPIAVTDGLKGMSEALTAVFPRPRSRPASSI